MNRCGIVIVSQVCYCTKLNESPLHSCAQKNKKNAEHTRMYTVFRSLFLSIFTSVVVYSRTNKHKHRQRKTCVVRYTSMQTFFVYLCSIKYAKHLSNFFFTTTFSELSQKNVDHVFIRFAWMFFVNERHNIFRLTFFFAKMFFELEKKKC